MMSRVAARRAESRSPVYSMTLRPLGIAPRANTPNPCTEERVMRKGKNVEAGFKTGIFELEDRISTTEFEGAVAEAAAAPHSIHYLGRFKSLATNYSLYARVDFTARRTL